MFYYNKYTYQILDRYRTHMPLEDTVPIGFTGVAGQRPAAALTTKFNQDILLFGATVDFSNAQVLVRIKSQSPSYEWMANDDALPQDTPVNALAGVFSQALPIIPLVQPYFLKKQGQLLMQFTNATAGPITGGLWTWRGLRLTD